MNNFYNITRGQLIAIWVFGIPMAYFIPLLLDINGGSPLFGGLILFGFPFLIIFYTLGWRNRGGNKAQGKQPPTIDLDN